MVEFVGMIGTRHVSEIRRSTGPVIDPAFLTRFARAHEDGGFDRVLIGYGSGDPEGTQVAAHVAARTERLGLLIAHRPGFVFPTLAARTFATLDHLSGGRVAVHVITGGNDADQRREGDFLGKDERYARTDEYLQVLRRAWEEGPFDHEGRFYRLSGFASDVRTGDAHPGLLRRLLGGGPAGWWPPRGRVRVLGRAPGRDRRADRRRPGHRDGRRTGHPAADQRLVPSDPRSDRRRGLGARPPHPRHDTGPRFAGVVRRHDTTPHQRRAAGERRVAATARRRRTGRTARPGVVDPDGRRHRRRRATPPHWSARPRRSPQALLDYVDIGVTTLLIRGFDPLDDAIDYGRHLIPLVRARARPPHPRRGCAVSAAADWPTRRRWITVPDPRTTSWSRRIGADHVGRSVRAAVEG